MNETRTGISLEPTVTFRKDNDENFLFRYSLADAHGIVPKMGDFVYLPSVNSDGSYAQLVRYKVVDTQIYFDGMHRRGKPVDTIWKEGGAKSRVKERFNVYLHSYDCVVEYFPSPDDLYPMKQCTDITS